MHKAILLTVIGLVAASILCALLYLIHPWQRELRFSSAEYENVIAAYEAGDLTAAGRIARVPEAFIRLTIDDMMYVLPEAACGDVYIFYVLPGVGEQPQKYAYHRCEEKPGCEIDGWHGGMIPKQHVMGYTDADFDKVIAAYEAGDLAAAGAIVKLSDEHSKLTVDDTMYITQIDCGAIYLFRTWQGKGSNFQGYAYHRGKYDHSENMKDWNELVSFMLREPGYTMVGVDIEKMHVVGWYRVWRDTD